jgi:hypothetical protein|tara:strand:- start:365 stop:499 length:135 start_codon:yes stop_codon:yes gene_type:complete
MNEAIKFAEGQLLSEWSRVQVRVTSLLGNRRTPMGNAMGTIAMS